MRKVILILGMHRSGTSLMAHICQSMGGYLGEDNELMDAREDNPAGFFEHKDIVRINDEILHYCDSEWYSLKPIKVNCHSSQIIKKMGELESIIWKMLMKQNIVVIKDPRIALLLPLWGKVLNELRVETDYIWEFRNPLEVADSLKKRDGYSKKHSLLLWAHYNINISNYLTNKHYLLVNYRDVLEEFQTLYDLCRLFDMQMNTDIRKKIKSIIKPEYCHSYYQDQIIQESFVSNIYNILLGKTKEKMDWNEEYIKELKGTKNRYIDYEILEDKKNIENRNVIIYGAGYCGHQVAKMLQEMDFCKFDFCDRDSKKYGTKIMGGEVFSIQEIEEKQDLLVIIAIENQELKKEAEETLICINGIKLLSVFALKKVWKYSTNDFNGMKVMAEMLSFHYRFLEQTAINIENACKYPLLVYQNGKVGSSTISSSLWESGIRNAHIHRFFKRKSNDKFTEMIYGDQLTDFIDESNDFQFLEYIKKIKDAIKGKKIITMVRDPIAVDLATIFQWMGTGYIDRYFTEQLKNGNDFSKAVVGFMLKIQNRLFDWFDEELKKICDVDVFAYPFDCEKGYTIIENQDIKILLLKAEKISQMGEVIRKFIGNDQFELLNTNMGKDKDYAHIYEKIKEKIVLPREYIDFYYKENNQVSHFYNKAEQENMKKKWMHF